MEKEKREQTEISLEDALKFLQPRDMRIPEFLTSDCCSGRLIEDLRAAGCGLAFSFLTGCFCTSPLFALQKRLMRR
jgi:hypothetical protein